MKINVPKHANFIIETLMEHGYEAYVVGGCVRDSLLHKEPKDWDITTSASPKQVKQLFSHTIDTGIEHGTVTVMMGKEPYEVTTYRIDGKYEDHRRPTEVTFTKCLKEDLLRRDFTINAMAYNEKEGLIDLYGGVEDLEIGLIRCVGEARQRFDEDALRILRALRFAARFDFTIEETTRQAMVEKKEFLKDISAERIREELTKILVSPHPEVLVTAYKLGITKILLPEWDKMMQTPQNHPHHKYSVGMHTLCGIQGVESDVVLRYTMLLHDVGKPDCRTTDEKGIDHFKGHPLRSKDIARKILKRLKFDNDTLNKVLTLVEWHDWRFHSLEEVNKKGVRRLASRIGVEMCYLLFKVQKADVLAQSQYQQKEKLEILNHTKLLLDEIVADDDCLTLKDLQMDGRELMKLGVKPGKEMGKILHDLLFQVIEQPQLNQKDTLTNLVCKMQKERIPVIRPAKQSEWKELAEIEKQCFPSAEAATQKAIRMRMEAFPENFLVAEICGTIVGFINGGNTDEQYLPDEMYSDIRLHKPEGAYMTVFGLNVLPQYRKQGIAAKLVGAYTELAKERKKKGIILTCKDHLIHYYEKFGFVHYGIADSSHGGVKWNDMRLLW